MAARADLDDQGRMKIFAGRIQQGPRDLSARRRRRYGSGGVTASITTVVSKRIVPAVPEMSVDRPILVTVRDRARGALLFFGRIAIPAEVRR